LGVSYAGSSAVFPNFFERDPNLNLINTSRPKPQTAYEKIMIVWMIFGSCYVRVQCQQSIIFSSTYATDRHRQAV